MTDFSSIHPTSVNQAHLVELHLWRGAPINHDASNPVEILVNHGYVVGYCPTRLQPAWSAYRVALASDDVDYERPIHYHEDLRLDESIRISGRTFGRLGGVQLNVGHMTPNEVINRQFGRLAQMETFLMSNMSPQYASLNQGVWLKLETAIRNIEDEDDKDHVWVIVGPVFGADPAAISRGAGKHLPVPESYFCITVDPFQYPFDTPSKVNFDCFIIPQDAPRSASPLDYPSTLAEIEAATNLEFFKAWARDLPVGSLSRLIEKPQSRLEQILEAQKNDARATGLGIKQARPEDSTSIPEMVDALKLEAEDMTKVGRPLIEAEVDRLNTIQHTLSWLIRAEELGKTQSDTAAGTTLITYKIIDDMEDQLKAGARTACNFWNRFVQPRDSIVIRLGLFTQSGPTIARAYKPFSDGRAVYGRVEFNTRYLSQFSANEIAGTIIHEIGHSLGIGWDAWDTLFHEETGLFKSAATKRLSALKEMVVELEGGAGTELAHWDEEIFDKELMTGYQDSGEYVLPVTIDVMRLLGHKVIERLTEPQSLDSLLQTAESMIFSRQSETRHIDLDYFTETELFETIPHGN